MTEIRDILVDYFTYCPICKHKEKSGNDEPCNECLSYPANVGSEKPVKYEFNK